MTTTKYTVYRSNEDGFIGLYTGGWTDVPRLTTLGVFEDFEEARAFLKDKLAEPAKRFAKMMKAYGMNNRELREQGKPYVAWEDFVKEYSDGQEV